VRVAPIRHCWPMVLITEQEIGRAAWARMRADASIVTLTATSGLPADVPSSPALRAASIVSWLPARCAITAAAALWVRGFGAQECPLPFHVVVPRGRHPDPPPGHSHTTWRWHTDGAAFSDARVVGGLLLTSAAHAIAASLRLDALEVALPSAAQALAARACSVRDVDRVMLAQPSRTTGRDRQLGAWAALKSLSREVDASRP
jgi:hypothetical protein